MHWESDSINQSVDAVATIADHSKMETDELTQEAYDKLRERVQVLEI